MKNKQSINNQQFSNVLFIIVSFTLLLLVVFAYQHVHTWAYNKISPYTVTIYSKSISDVQINVQYDYGYGYLPEHQQIFNLESELEGQTTILNISAWKKLKKIRVYSTNPDQLKIEKVGLMKGGNVLNLFPPTNPIIDKNVSIEVIIDNTQIYGKT